MPIQRTCGLSAACRYTKTSVKILRAPPQYFNVSMSELQPASFILSTPGDAMHAVTPPSGCEPCRHSMQYPQASSMCGQTYLGRRRITSMPTALCAERPAKKAQQYADKPLVNIDALQFSTQTIISKVCTLRQCVIT